nr:rhodanese-like domain-containing protein [uncultured Holophaga sp.]
MLGSTLRLIVIAFIILLVLRLVLRFVRNARGLSVDLLNDLKSRNALVLDVRTRAEYGGGHVVGSLNIPLDELPRRLGELQRQRPILVCCASGARSGQAMQFLLSQGFQEVHNAGPWQNAR